MESSGLVTEWDPSWQCEFGREPIAPAFAAWIATLGPGNEHHGIINWMTKHRWGYTILYLTPETRWAVSKGLKGNLTEVSLDFLYKSYQAHKYPVLATFPNGEERTVRKSLAVQLKLPWREHD